MLGLFFGFDGLRRDGGEGYSMGGRQAFRFGTSETRGYSIIHDKASFGKCISSTLSVCITYIHSLSQKLLSFMCLLGKATIFEKWSIVHGSRLMLIIICIFLQV